MKLKDLLKESWTVKDGSVLSNGKLIGYYDFDRDSDSFWVDDVKKGIRVVFKFFNEYFFRVAKIGTTSY